MEDFSDYNLKVGAQMGYTSRSPLPGGHPNAREGKKQLRDPEECIRAYFNFCTISRQYHIRSTMALLRLVLNKSYPVTASVSQYSTLFEKFTQISKYSRVAPPLRSQGLTTASRGTSTNPTPLQQCPSPRGLHNGFQEIPDPQLLLQGQQKQPGLQK